MAADAVSLPQSMRSLFGGCVWGVAGLAAGIFCLAVLDTGNPITWLYTLISLMIVVSGLGMVIRRVRVGPDSVSIRRLWGTKTIPLSDIRSVDVEVYLSPSSGSRVAGPIIRTVDGKSHTVPSLATVHDNVFGRKGQPISATAYRNGELLRNAIGGLQPLARE